jgi:nucleolar protein 56
VFTIDFPKDTDKLSGILFDIDHGILPEILGPLREMQITQCDNASIAENLGCRPISLEMRQSLIGDVMKDRALSDEERMLLRDTALALVKKQINVASSSKDLSISQAINAVDELDQTINLFTERLVEWYGIHFPELERLVPDNSKYCEIIESYGFREDIEDNDIAAAAKDSIGAQLSSEDMDEIRKLAHSAVQLSKIREGYSEYIEENVSIIAPNMTQLVGPLITARLIALAGGLRNLAQKPASTIQMLGAEKALFRHLKTGAKPPKHGIIFQHPEIHNAKPWHRGKIARSLAAELAIAARVDYNSGEMVADSLSKKIEERIREIKAKYPYPPRAKSKMKGGRKR